MSGSSRAFLSIAREYQQILPQLGLDSAEAVFRHPQIQVWRSITERENAVLDGVVDGKPIRLHVKRYHPDALGKTPAEQEVEGIFHLERAKIPTVAPVMWGSLPDRRSFVVTEDLAGYEPADKLVVSGLPFERLLEPTANLAARLHGAGLHHRDLYLCHFFANPASDPIDLKLIDPARVRPLPAWFARRWIIKDLAQFWYSTLELSIPGAQRRDWLERYAAARGELSVDSLQKSIDKKVKRIAEHDAKLRQKQPTRNVSIPGK